MDGLPKYVLEVKAGRGMRLDGHGEDEYKWPDVYLFPEKPDKRYSYFPSTAGTKCSFRKLSRKEKELIKQEAWGQCKKDRFKYCYGWN